MAGYQRFARGALLCALAVMMAACATTNRMSASDFVLPTEKARVLMLAPTADMALITAGGVREARADWTETAIANLNENFKTQLSAKGLDVVAQDPAKDIDGQLLLLSEMVMVNAIMLGPNSAYGLPTKKDQFDWTMGDAVKPLGAAYDADYAMFVYSFGNFASAANQALQVGIGLLFGGVVIPSGGERLTLISLIDLQDGDLVWVDARAMGDVRNPTEASAIVGDLVKRLSAQKPKPKPIAAEPAKVGS
jgi:hypothetical protein